VIIRVPFCKGFQSINHFLPLLMRIQLKYCVQCQLSRFNHVGGQAGKANRGNMWFAFQQSYENVAQKLYGLIRHLSCGGCFLQFLDNLLVVNYCQF
jgi:hypothetical protein